MSDVSQLPAKGEIFALANPIEVLLEPLKFEAFYQSIVKQTEAFTPDVTTQRGRDAIKAVAFKVTKTKTFLDEFGKRLNEDRRKEINVVDAARRTMRDKLEALKETVRAPLTEWEEAEKKRLDLIETTMNTFRHVSATASVGTIEEIEFRRASIELMVVDPAIFGEEAIFAENARTIALADLDRAIDAARKTEADRAEIERLRSEAEARRQADVERGRQEASRIAEEQCREAEAAEASRREQEAVRAAQEVVERKAAKERQEAEDVARRELMAERQRVAILEEAERQRLAREQRIADETAARQKDAQHRLEVRNKAAEAISTIGAIGLPKADKIVMAIIAGEIPAVRLDF